MQWPREEKLALWTTGEWKEVRVKGDRNADDSSVARMRAIADARIIFKSLIDVRQELADGRLVALLTDWETEAYWQHALLPNKRFIPNRARAQMEFLGTKFSGSNAN
ncbi:hypothetical protein ACO0LG_27295 [Undibacterium sp. Ji42W]|uniref:hypothetical protein n=1 Tax=Undibacterium sp. Ji42W TaxID=3413039 RepID=UPI003BF31449